jgi:hypothetical protein
MMIGDVVAVGWASSAALHLVGFLDAALAGVAPVDTTPTGP